MGSNTMAEGMKLSDLIEMFKGHDKVLFKLTGIGEMEYGTVEFKDAIDTIEALQQENNGWQERYYELDAGHSRLFKDFCKLQKENEQLRKERDQAIRDIDKGNCRSCVYDGKKSCYGNMHGKDREVAKEQGLPYCIGWQWRGLEGKEDE